MERKKIGLALGSGGARGFCHVGVLQAFEENNIPIDFITGCSHGSLVGGCYASGITVEKMKEVAKKSTTTSIVDLNISLKNNGLIKGQKAINIIKNLIGDKQIEDCEIPFKATASNVCTGELVVFDKGSLLDAMRASISIPIAFHAVEQDKDNVLVDGGVIERIPIPAVKEMGADVVIAVDALGPLKDDFKRTKGFLNMIERVYLMLDWQSSKEKLKQADLVISPDQGERSIVDFKDNLYSVQCGYDAAIAAMPRILELIS